MDARHFPYVFECADCPDDSTAEITYSEAVDELPFGVKESDVTPRKAVNNALTSRGWWEIEGERMCPQCIERIE